MKSSYKEKVKRLFKNYVETYKEVGYSEVRD